MIDRHPTPGKAPQPSRAASDEPLSSPHEREPDTTDGDADHADAAEAVRRALVRLREGALFLSPKDAELLVGWLDEGVGVARILGALEAAAKHRRAKRARVPLQLTHAKRFLAKVPDLAPRPRAPLAADDAHPFAPMLRDALRLPPPLDAAGRALADALTPLGPADVDAAADAVGAFHERAWLDLGAAGQARYVDRARDELADVLLVVDDGTGDALLAEHARALARAATPSLDVLTLLHLVDACPP